MENILNKEELADVEQLKYDPSTTNSDFDVGNDNGDWRDALAAEENILKHVNSNVDETETHSSDNVDNGSDIKMGVLDIEIVLPKTYRNVQHRQKENGETCKKELEEKEEEEKLQVSNPSKFTNEQLDKYEIYRNIALPEAALERLMQTATRCSVPQNAITAVAEVAKVFVGIILEEAQDVVEEIKDSGPLQPQDLREAVRRIRQQGGDVKDKIYYRL